MTYSLILVATLVVETARAEKAARGPLLNGAQQWSWGERLRGGAACADSGALTCPTLFSEMKTWHPVLLALLGTSFGWFMTALGSAAVVVHRLGLPDKTYRKVLDFMLGLSGGVMTAASYWSLLAPALEFAEAQGWGEHRYVPVALGFLSGGVLLQATDRLLARVQGSLEDLDLYKGLAVVEEGAKRSRPASPASPAARRSASPARRSPRPTKKEGKQASLSREERGTRFRKMLMLLLAITIHNFPEGMAVGVAFGAIGSSPGATLGGAISLALGIGIQNFPEGLAVSMPLMREGVSPLKSFWYGQLSGLVEPIGGLLGAAFVHYCRPMLPYTMSLAAGAMIYVVCDSLVPEMQAHGNKGLAMQGFMLGFVIMMILDVALG